MGKKLKREKRNARNHGYTGLDSVKQMNCVLPAGSASAFSAISISSTGHKPSPGTTPKPAKGRKGMAASAPPSTACAALMSSAELTT